MSRMWPWKVADFGMLKGRDEVPWGERFYIKMSGGSDGPTLTGLVSVNNLSQTTILKALLSVKVSK